MQFQFDHEKWLEILKPYGPHIAGGIGLLVVLYVGRKYTWPYIALMLEIAVFSVGTHLFFYVLLIITTWFRSATSVRFLEDGSVAKRTDLQVPLYEVWKQDLYNPGAMFYIEIATFLFIVYVVLWFRPMSLDRRNTYRGKVPQGGKKKKALIFAGSNLSQRPARFAKKR